MLNRANFFKAVRVNIFNGSLNEKQVVSMESILDEFEHRELPDLRYLAYMYGTVYRECGANMWPVEEWGKGAGKQYGIPSVRTGQVYYGRGLVQLTWEENYRKMAALIKVDIVNNPEKALELDTAVTILFEGMLRANSGVGDFTNHSLDMYFTPEKSDWFNARRIINGLDHAQEIADNSRKFFDALYGASL